MLVAGCRHAGDDWGKYRVERLIDLAHAARKLNRDTIDANGRKRYTGGAPNEPAQHDDVQS